MEKESERLNTAMSKLLIRCRLDMEAEFVAGKKKRSVLWGKVLDSMKAVNPDVPDSKEVLQRKFLNLLASYKRIKRRNKESGRDATTWEYFDEFDAMYGCRHSVEPPEENLQSSLASPSGDESECDLEEQVGSARKRSKKTANEAISFFKEEASKEQNRHEDVLRLEREKLEIEKEKIRVLNSLRDILAKRT
ncbi:uncharacterized protein LOC128861215 [Anastrepha ludens]|uniref:uncharacterized protein LOC128861215 n=1 Tax=Anastrepha ludens TaxID=28586 RepID=UPI0023B01B16|nr:uncharacterized protein LOC128861215 [Anastrepha ludens]